MGRDRRVQRLSTAAFMRTDDENIPQFPREAVHEFAGFAVFFNKTKVFVR
jgi:hypothetical protein